MNIRSSGAAACLLAAGTAGSGTVTASPPCAVITSRNEAQPKRAVPKTCALQSCAPEQRFRVSIIIMS